MFQKNPGIARILRNAAISIIGFGLLLTFNPAAGAQTSVNYVFTTTTAGGFGMLNLSTGAWTQIVGEGAFPLAGLGVTGNILFGAHTSTFYLVDQGNGNPTAVGQPASFTYADFGSTSDGTLYAIDTNLNLYSINPSNGQATLLQTLSTMSAGCELAMSSGAGVLYIATEPNCGEDSYLYSWSPAGGLTFLGQTNINRLRAMVYVDGVLYGANVGELTYLWIIPPADPSHSSHVGPTPPFAGMAAVQSATYTSLYKFTGGQDGAVPTAPVTLDAAGNLYGTASQGGDTTVCTGTNNLPLGCGTAYKLKPGASGYTFDPLYKFQGGEDGATPLAGLVFGPNGTLYGTTSTGGLTDCAGYFPLGCGTVFNLQAPPTFCRSVLCSWNETVLHHFDQSDGAVPGYGNLTFDAHGNIYGTTEYGGSGGHCDYGFYGCGTVYELMGSGGNWTESVLYNFDAGLGGGEPQSGVIFDQSGNLYGTTKNGGQGGEGAVYQLASPSWMENILYNAWNSLCPIVIIGGLTFDSSGNLYGTSNNCGEYGQGYVGQGFVYELTPPGGYPWTYNQIYTFAPDADHAAGPWSNVVFDSSGNLYGTLHGSLAVDDYGRVFELTKVDNIWTQKLLWMFTGGTDGAIPVATVTLDANGDLYGTTTAGGNLTDCNGAGCGVVYKITLTN